MKQRTFPIRIQELAYREADAEYDIGPHSHNIYQLYCVLRGDVTMWIEGEDHILPAGQLIIVSPGKERAPRCSGRAPVYAIAMLDAQRFAIDELCNRPLVLNELMLQQMEALIADLVEPDLGNAQDYRTSIICQILIDLRRQLRAGSTTNQLPRHNANARNDVVAQAEAFMDAHLHLSINRQQIAEAVHFSAPHLARLFKASLGKTINQRLTEMRLEQAKRFLLQSTYPITQIAGEVGFQSFSHFAKLFQQATGMTPSEYRSGLGRRIVRK